METARASARERADRIFDEIRDGAGPARVVPALTDLDPRQLDGAGVVKLGRALSDLEWDAGPVRIAYLSNLTVSDLLPHVAVWAAREGISLEQWTAPFGQHVQQVVDPGGELRSFDPDVVLVLLEPRLLRAESFQRFSTLSADARRALADDVLDEVLAVVEGVTRRVGANAVVANFVPPLRPGAGVADAKLPFGETELFARLNLELLDRLRGEPTAQLLDLQRCMAAAGRAGRDPRRFYLAKMAWSGPAVAELGEEVARHVFAAKATARKCVVVDLDNTLWGGVVGEDGVNGIRVGPGDPVGEAYLDVQRRLLELKERGILLAIASKNNEADVREAFEERRMVLSLEDFAVTQIHWRPKYESLVEIAATLDIGVDSLVFVDDNPAEVTLVNEALPKVRTILLSGDPATFPDRIAEPLYFEKAAILDEDRGKTRQYHQQAERARHRENVGDLEDYLGSLETVVRIRTPGEEDLQRLHQLFTKTNQFNVTTIRHSSAELKRLLADAGARVVIWEVADRFGHLGTVGAYVLREVDAGVEVDSFLMSCRALGRQVETAVMNHLKRTFLDGALAGPLRARYIRTPKNQPVASFFDDQGFRRMTEDPGGDGPEQVRYELARGEVELLPCDWITVEEEVLA
ncbi:MAG: HAD-IIIC family phosphatase [Gemmatimonadota bacterium]|jgi:FkbH-like protein